MGKPQGKQKILDFMESWYNPLSGQNFVERRPSTAASRQKLIFPRPQVVHDIDVNGKI